MLVSKYLEFKYSDKENGWPFGAVIEKDGKIIARGRNTVILSKNLTAHALM